MQELVGARAAGGCRSWWVEERVQELVGGGAGGCRSWWVQELVGAGAE